MRLEPNRRTPFLMWLRPGRLPCTPVARFVTTSHPWPPPRTTPSPGDEANRIRTEHFPRLTRQNLAIRISLEQAEEMLKRGSEKTLSVPYIVVWHCCGMFIGRCFHLSDYWWVVGSRAFALDSCTDLASSSIVGASSADSGYFHIPTSN